MAYNSFGWCNDDNCSETVETLRMVVILSLTTVNIIYLVSAVTISIWLSSCRSQYSSERPRQIIWTLIVVILSQIFALFQRTLELLLLYGILQKGTVYLTLIYLFTNLSHLFVLTSYWMYVS